MRRVVVTGMGIVSSIGNNTQEVLASLREAKSGIVHAEKYAALGFRCRSPRRSKPRVGGDGSPQRRAASWRPVSAGASSPWSRRFVTPGLRARTSSTNEPASLWARAGPPPRAIVRAAGRDARERPEKIGPFEVPKECARPVGRPAQPPCRSRASTIRSLSRRARHRRIASAMPPRLDSVGQAGRDVCGGCGGAWTGRCRRSLMP